MKRLINFLGISGLLIGMISSTVYASEETELGGYTIEGIQKENQLDPKVGYFYLHENVGSEDSVKVKLINSSERDKRLNIKITNANTNGNGIIDYTGNLKDHSSLKTPLTSIANATEKEVVVPKESSVEAEIKIKMPKEQLSGVVVGGIVVSEKQPESSSKDKIALRNTYSYTLGLVVTNENKVELDKNISVELDGVEATLSDGRKIVQANILNPNPYIFGEATISGEIVDSSTNKVIKKTKKEKVKIAPQSVYPLRFDWKKEDLKPGVYWFFGKVKTSDKEWNLKKKFTISKEKAKRINDESVFKVQIPNWLKYGSVVISILTVLFTILIIVRMGKNEKL